MPFKENHSITGLTARHNHNGIFNRKSDCWRKTHVTTFGGRRISLCGGCQSYSRKYLSATFINITFVVVSHKIFWWRCVAPPIDNCSVCPLCYVTGPFKRYQEMDKDRL